VAQGMEYPINFIVWSDPSQWSLGIDTDWTTLNIYWGQMKGKESRPYAPNGLVDVVRIFHQPDKGLYGLHFHDLSGQYGEKKKMSICSNSNELGGELKFLNALFFG